LAQTARLLNGETAAEIFELLDLYGPIPPLDGIDAENLFRRLAHDKKTVQGKVHFVLPVRVGEVVVTADVGEEFVRSAIRMELP
jgi:3-dehydroquinate synthase